MKQIRLMRKLRNKVPMILQFAQSECGICCAAMILEFWGYRGAVYELRKEIDPGRDGVNFKDIASLLRDRGIETKFVRANLAGLRNTNSDFPVILFWRGCHAVVLEKITSSYVVIADPAIGKIRVSQEQFSEDFSGFALLCSPTPEFTPVRKKNYSLRSIWNDLATRNYFTRFSKVLLLSIVLYAFTLVIPIFIKNLINDYQELLSNISVYSVITVLILPFFVFLVFGILRTRVLASMVSFLGEDLMGGVFKKLLKMPYPFFASRSNGELMTRLSSVTQLRDLVSNQITAALLDFGVVLFIVVYLFAASPILATVSCSLGTAMVFANALTWTHLKRYTDEEIRSLGLSAGTQMEAISSMSLVKTTGMTESFYGKWQQDYKGALESGRKRMILQGNITAFVSAVQMFGPFIVLAVGVKLFVDGTGSLGDVIAAQSLTSILLASMSSLSLAISQFVKAQVQLSRIIDVMMQEPDMTWGNTNRELSGQMSVRGLQFSYPGSKEAALQDITFDLYPGEKIAIVGKTGSGKSTLAKVLVGLFPPNKGTITMDGWAFSDMTEDSFRKAVAYVPQDIQLSNRQIAENIDFTGQSPDLLLVKDAASVACISETIEKMPLGYHTEIQEMGANVSGGQRQRIAIARAVARRPRLIVLDEATSSLDNITEKKVAESLARLQSSQIIVAHRLSTIQTADRILVFKDGNIAETGTYEELLAKNGEFFDLVKDSHRKMEENLKEKNEQRTSILITTNSLKGRTEK